VAGRPPRQPKEYRGEKKGGVAPRNKKSSKRSNRGKERQKKKKKKPWPWLPGKKSHDWKRKMRQGRGTKPHRG